MKRIVCDLDGTICNTVDGNYANAQPNSDVIKALHEYKRLGFEIIIFTSRNMRTYHSCIDTIKLKTLPVILEWLQKYAIPYDDILVGKPWCGTEGFYVDDRAVRPEEFSSLSYEEICKLIG
jgi:capsule biosynthesis phosphatase